VVTLTKNVHDLELSAPAWLQDQNRVHSAAPVLGVD